jgi:hypothetical protein
LIPHILKIVKEEQRGNIFDYKRLCGTVEQILLQALETKMDHEWVTAIASTVGSFGIVFVAIQTKLVNKNFKIAAEQLKISSEQLKISSNQLKADHERSRRTYALEVLERWTNKLDKAHTSARS